MMGDKMMRGSGGSSIEGRGRDQVREELIEARLPVRGSATKLLHIGVDPATVNLAMQGPTSADQRGGISPRDERPPRDAP
jgi:hypothetical protein